MISRVLFFLFLLSLLSYSSSQVCSQFTTCLDCIVQTGCGFCESTSQCLAGNKLGPGGNPANCSEWFFETCLLVPCSTHKTCLSCTQDPFCGFCASNHQCLEGDKTGPIFGSCGHFLFGPG